MPDEPKKITFNYLKNASFETRRVDGAYGGVTPSLDIFMALYCQRPVIPQTETFPVEDDHKLGQRIDAESVTKKGIVREVHTGTTMSVPVAKEIVEWLQSKIAQAEKVADENQGVKADAPER